MPRRPIFDLVPLVRVNYFSGQLLSADDFQAEQAYHRDQRRLHNRLLLGAGVVTGLEVSVSGIAVTVSPGLALDCLGREVLVPGAQSALLPDGCDDLYVCVRYAERPIQSVPITPSGSESDRAASRIEETFLVELAPITSVKRHSRTAGPWQPCGEDHGIPIARLRCQRRWRVDAKYVRARVKGAGGR